MSQLGLSGAAWMVFIFPFLHVPGPWAGIHLLWGAVCTPRRNKDSFVRSWVMIWAAFFISHCFWQPLLLYSARTSSVLTLHVRSGRIVTIPSVWECGPQITAGCHRNAYRKRETSPQWAPASPCVFLLQFFYLFFLLSNKKKKLKEERGRQMLPDCHFLVNSINKHLGCANPSAGYRNYRH